MTEENSTFGAVKKEQERTRINKARMLEALERNRALVNVSCREVGIAPSTHRKWMQEDPEYRESFGYILGLKGDSVENKLDEKIEEGDLTAIIFYCKTKLKNRGFNERTEITGANGEPLIPRSIEEAKKIIDGE